MSLKPLIKDQRIRIDNHRRGTSQENNWEDPTADIHIDKITRTKFEGKRAKARIKLPINSEREPTFEINNCPDDRLRRKLTMEIREVLSGKQRLKDFTKDLAGILRGYKSMMNEKEKVREAIRRLANHFGLAEPAIREVTTYIDEELFSFLSFHRDTERENLFFIIIDRRRIVIDQL